MTNKRQVTQPELEQHLVEQLQFLEASAEAFDRGLEGEAKRLAVTLRVLLHDTKNSHSLLGQLGRKTLLFWNTAIPEEPGNLLTHGGLVMIALGGPQPKYIAMLDEVPAAKRVPFDQWWSTSVFVDDKKQRLSRRDLVLIAADQDGGAHVDPSLDETYARLSRENSMRWTVVGPAGTVSMLGPERAAIRQIAHEVIKSLKHGYEKKPTISANVIVGGPAVVTVKSPSRTPSPVPKVGRNEPCPCGSGKKYKRCHGMRT